MRNVMILSAGRRVELVQSFATELKSRGLASRVIAGDMRPELSAACQISDCSIRTPSASDSSYIDFLYESCIEYKIGLVVPTIDTDLLVLAQSRARFERAGVNIIISDEDFVRRCRDKRLTEKLFTELGISTPKIFCRDSIKIPCFAKPYDGSCSVGATPVLTKDMLSAEMISDEKLIFMELVDSNFEEYSIDAYYDRNQRLRCLVPRHRIEIRSGEISKGVTRRNHVYSYLLERIQGLHGARGCITLQMFASSNGDKFAALEINPRFGGGFPLTYGAGANYPGWLIDEYILNKDVPFKDDWEQNLLMLRYDAKVMTHGF